MVYSPIFYRDGGVSKGSDILSYFFAINELMHPPPA
jgi:hypothetical protein